MANEMWHVAVDGTQLPGEHETADARELLRKNAGKQLRVWTAGMAGWADPATLPQFKEEPVPSMASSKPTFVEPPARPAPAPAPVPSSYNPPAPASAAAPAPATRRPMPTMSQEELQQQAGIFKALLDTSFTTLLTPKLIRGVYIIFLVIIGLGLVGGILASLAGFAAGFGRGIMGLVFAVIVLPLVAVLYLSMIRMSLEVIMAIFKIKESAAILAEKAKRDDS